MAPAQNQIVAALPLASRHLLLALCEPVDLLLAEVLCEAGESSRHVYFPVDGFISLITVLESHPGIEVGMVGREGMLGAQLALGLNTTPLRAVVQGRGRAWRIGSRAFRAELGRSQPLRRCVQRYLCVVMAQLADSISCVRFHLIGPRLARWLLMSQDRSHADTFPVTQETVADMLGVRRVGITVAAGILRRDGLIDYRRGQVTVLNRAGLEAAACSCYASHRRAHVTLA